VLIGFNILISDVIFRGSGALKFKKYVQKEEKSIIFDNVDELAKYYSK
jgi:hypothetical protein